MRNQSQNPATAISIALGGALILVMATLPIVAMSLGVQLSACMTERPECTSLAMSLGVINLLWLAVSIVVVVMAVFYVRHREKAKAAVNQHSS